MNTTLNHYEIFATDFADRIGLTIKIGAPTYGKHFGDEDQERFIFPVTLLRGGKSYRLKFGQSLREKNTPPTAYDILACLTKYNPESFEFFCANYGYDTDSRKAEKVYKKVLKEWEGVQRIFSDVLEQLADIN
jgi:hypothetical protein